MKSPHFLISLAVLGLLAAPVLATRPGGEPATGGGTLSGKVVFAGEAKDIPKAKVLDMSSKPEHAEHCLQAADKNERSFLVDPATRGIANVFVEIRKVTKEKWQPAGEIHPVDQNHCRFEPHVMVVPVGKEITFANSDPFMHNVHFYCRKNPQANFGIPEHGSKKVTLKSDEKIRVKCDVHPWMESWVIATSNPYHALTGKDGSFSIPNVPPGTYEVRFWHEKLGMLKVKKFEIGADGATLEVKHDDPSWKS